MGADEGGDEDFGVGGDAAAMYDRQIRLWGVSAQQRLSQTVIALVGDASALLLQEVAKNVVLAGIRELVLVEPTVAAQQRHAAACGTPCRGFLGSNASQVKQALNSINPLVQVRLCASSDRDAVDGSRGGGEDGDAGDGEDGVEKADVVCVVSSVLDEAYAGLARRCRARGGAFYIGATYGMLAAFAADFGARTFSEESTVFSARKDGGESSPKKRRVEVTVESAPYPSLLGFNDWSSARVHRRSKCGLFVFQALESFAAKYGRLPCAMKHGEEDAELFVKHANKLAVEMKLSEERVPRALLDTAAQTAASGVPSVAAVLGGVLARELLKHAMRTQPAIAGVFYFDAHSSRGVVEHVGA
mmetsp:Transcript_7433/g.19810  ORF Transcript_7433/g.19810 Transcript_7433/m.19810 type:complete len:359 (+) Transcript_7433:355-1431(+)